MNKTLKFSWGHIIAALALVATGYVSFMGYAYMTEGNFLIAGIATAITLVFYIIIFIGAQVMKGSGVKFDRTIVWERIFIFGSPLFFIAGMVGFSHFWVVHGRQEQLKQEFTEAIGNSRQLFSDYRTYTDKRLNDYDRHLTAIVSSRNSRKLAKAGFQKGLEKLQKDNMMKTLTLQLRSANYDSVENAALKWIDKSTRGATVWNVFLLGNIEEISNALVYWENTLNNYADKRMSNEPTGSKTSQYFESHGARKAAGDLEGMKVLFSESGPPVWQAIVSGLVIYIMLLFPYFIQQRHGRQVAMGYHLRGRKKITFGADSDGLSAHIMRDNSTTAHSKNKCSGSNVSGRPENSNEDHRTADPTQNSPDEDPFAFINLSSGKKK